MPGRASGMTSRRRICQRVAPSMMPASSISMGISRTNVAISQVASGMEKATKMSTSPGSVSMRSNRDIRKNNEMSATQMGSGIINMM